jgi:hypothetical protein
MNKAFGSSMTGDISFFAQHLKERKESVSFTVDDGFRFDDTSYFKVLHQVEPPEVLDIAEKIIANSRFYDLILAWNEKVLSNCSNAVFLPEAVCSWIARKKEKGVYQACNTSTKTFAVSFLTSNKTFCPGHKLRCEIYDKLPDAFGELKVIKHMSPPRWPDKRTIIEPYQYHIGVENAIHNNWFADKIVDAFIGKAIPIYWGCPNLEKYFNMEGVIRFSEYSDLEKTLKSLTPSFYQSRLYAVEDNFNRAMKYVHTWDRIEEEITKGIERKKSLAPAPTRPDVRQVLRIKRPLCQNP